MVSFIPFQRAFLEKLKQRVKSAKSQLSIKHQGWRKIAIIDVRDTPFALEYLTDGLRKWLKMQGFKLSGVLLLTRELSMRNSFIVIPNHASKDPVHSADYVKVLAKNPITSDWIFAMPMGYRFDAEGWYNMFHRTADGVLLSGDTELGTSLLAKDTIAFTGLLGLPKKVSRIKFLKNGREMANFNLF
jgi:hypothetical protein